MRQWKDIDGYEGLYQVSNDGIVKSLPKSITLHHGGTYLTKEKYLTNRITKDGYYMVALFNDGVRIDLKIHRIVAAAFCDKNGYEVNHKNGIKTDNRADNLEWCDRSHNIKHSYELGLSKKIFKDKFGFDHVATKMVIDTKTGEITNRIDAAKRLGISSTHFANMLNGRRNNKTNYKYV